MTQTKASRSQLSPTKMRMRFEPRTRPRRNHSQKPLASWTTKTVTSSRRPQHQRRFQKNDVWTCRQRPFPALWCGRSSLGDHEVDCIVYAKQKLLHVDAARKVFIDMLQTDYAIATDDVKNAFFCFVESVAIKMAHKRAIDDCLDRNLNLCSHSPCFMGTIVDRVMNSRTFSKRVARFVKRQMDKTVDDWRLATNEYTNGAAKNLGILAPSSPSPSSLDSSTIDGYRIFARGGIHNAGRNCDKKSRKDKQREATSPPSAKYVLPFSTSSRLSKVHFTDSDSSQERKKQKERKPHSKKLNKNPRQPVQQTIKRIFRRIIDYHIYRLKDCFSRCDDLVLQYIPKRIKKVRSQMRHTRLIRRTPSQ